MEILSNIKYYFYSKKRKYNNIDVYDALIYKEKNKYHIISILDKRYNINNISINNALIKPIGINIYENEYDDIDSLYHLTNYNSIESYQKNYSNINNIQFNEFLFLTDIENLIDLYNNNTYDCIEIILPNIKSITYNKEFVNRIINILHNEFSGDSSIYEKII